MGSGFKDFAAGDVLTANDVDGYLMRQTVMTFADASARDSALSGVLDEGMMAYLEDTNRTTYYDGSAWQDIATSSAIGTWQTYTPSITQSVAVTSTIRYAKYARVNDTVIGNAVVSATSSGTALNALAFSLPVVASNSDIVIGSGFVFDSSTSIAYGGQIYTASGGGSVFFIGDWASGGVWGTSPNLAIASGDVLYISFSYEVA